MEFISMLANVLSIDTVLASIIRKIKAYKNQNKLQNLDKIIDYEKVTVDMIRCAEEVDKYIAKHHQTTVNAKIVSDRDKKLFIDTFYDLQPDYKIYREYLDSYLNSYIDCVDEVLRSMMSVGEKFINKSVSDILAIVEGAEQKLRHVENTANQILPLAKTSVENSEILKAGVQGLTKDVECLKKQLTTKRKSLDDALLLIDKDYIDDQRVDAAQYERCKFEYYNVSTSTESVFKAVINGLFVATDEYEKISRTIYETAKRSSVLFLSADGGTGKSTLLCQVAVRAAEDGYKVYFFDGSADAEGADLDGQGCISEETFFLLDNVSSSQELVQKLYKLSEKNSYIHVILSARSHKINSLIYESEIPGWVVNGKAIMLKNDVHSVSYLPINKRNITEIFLSEELRKAMSAMTIASTINYHDLNEELAEKAQRALSYTNRSVTDIVLDFCVKYNTIAGKNATPIRPFDFDWDIWDEVPELKGTFRYLAALNCYGVDVSVHQMEKIAGHPLDIGKMVDEGTLPIVRVTDQAIIKLRHDTVADNYFKVNHLRAFDVIEDLFENRKLNNRTVLKFEKEAFSLSNIFKATKEVKKLHIPDLIYAFNRIDEYRKILMDHQRIHSLEFATIGVKAQGLKESKEYYRKQIGTSYENVYPLYSNSLFLWIKYFFFAVNHADATPEEMLIQLKTVPGLYKKVTKTIDDYIRRAYRSFTDVERNCWFAHTEKLFNWIIENIDSNDVPSRIILLWVYRHSGKINQAKNIISELSGMDGSLMRKSELSVIYIQAYESEVRQLVKRDRTDPEIRKINHFIRQYYKNLLEYTDKDTDEYITVVRSYVRFQKDTYLFNEAYQMALETVEYMTANHPEIRVSRLYVELGMICQYKKSRNKHFDLYEAITWFQRAVEEMKPSSRELLYALKPLCKSYLFMNRPEKCIEICDQIRAIDFRDKEIINIRYESMRLQEIKEKQLPVGEPYRRELDPTLEKVDDEFNKLIGEMTEEQLKFAELFDLQGYYHTSKLLAYRAAFSIRNNTYIPISTLLKLKINDKNDGN